MAISVISIQSKIIYLHHSWPTAEVTACQEHCTVTHGYHSIALWLKLCMHFKIGCSIYAFKLCSQTICMFICLDHLILYTKNTSSFHGKTMYRLVFCCAQICDFDFILSSDFVAALVFAYDFRTHTHTSLSMESTKF